MEVLASSGLNARPECKQYSREKSKEISFRGRIRVQIKNDDGTLCNPEFPSSKFLALELFLCGYCANSLIKMEKIASQGYDQGSEGF